VHLLGRDIVDTNNEGGLVGVKLNNWKISIVIQRSSRISESRETYKGLELIEVSGLGIGSAPHFFFYVSEERLFKGKWLLLRLVKGEEKFRFPISFFGAFASGSRGT